MKEVASRDQIIPAWRAVCLPIPAAGSDRAPPPLFQPCCCVAALLSFAAIWWGFLRTLVLFPLLTTVVWSTGHQRMTRCSPSTLDGTMSPLPSTDPILAIHHPKLGILLEEHCDRVDNAECYLWIQQNPGYGSPPEEYPSGADFLYKKILRVGTSNTHNMHVKDK